MAHIDPMPLAPRALERSPDAAAAGLGLRALPLPGALLALALEAASPGRPA